MINLDTLPPGTALQVIGNETLGLVTWASGQIVSILELNGSLTPFTKHFATSMESEFPGPGDIFLFMGVAVRSESPLVNGTDMRKIKAFFNDKTVEFVIPLKYGNSHLQLLDTTQC